MKCGILLPSIILGLVSDLDTLISTRCNCHFFGSTPIGYKRFEVACGEIGLGSGCMSVGRAYVSWFWGWGSSCRCCLRCFGRGSLAVYQSVGFRSGWRGGKIFHLLKV